jgi:hypothetical protein
MPGALRRNLRRCACVFSDEILALLEDLNRAQMERALEIVDKDRQIAELKRDNSDIAQRMFDVVDSTQEAQFGLSQVRTHTTSPRNPTPLEEIM